MKKALKLFVATLLVGSLLQAKSELTIDKAHSHVIFTIKHLMITNVTGEFREFDGEIEAVVGKKELTALSATINPVSIDTGIEKRDNHLRSPDFFNVEKYPEITFKMTGYKKSMFGDEGVMTGDLTIHGVTKEVQLKVNMSDPVKFRGEERIGMEMQGQINRKDFGLTWNKALETGGVVVGDEVKIKIDLQTVVVK